MAPGGPALRSHLPLRREGAIGTKASGVLAIAHELPMSEANRRQLVDLAARAGAAVAALPDA
jgi:hypothetical protein